MLNVHRVLILLILTSCTSINQQIYKEYIGYIDQQPVIINIIDYDF